MDTQDWGEHEFPLEQALGPMWMLLCQCEDKAVRFQSVHVFIEWRGFFPNVSLRYCHLGG